MNVFFVTIGLVVDLVILLNHECIRGEMVLEPKGMGDDRRKVAGGEGVDLRE